MNTPAIFHLAVCALVLAGCAKTVQPSSTPPAEQTWGAAERIAATDRFFLAGQADADTFARARLNGVDVVVDLRDPAEHDWDEAAAARKAGLGYYNVVIPRGQKSPYSAEGLAQIEQILDAHPQGKVLVHCGSGSRAAGWYAIHLARTRGLSTEEAIASAAATGLLGRSSESAARAYLEAGSAGGQN